MSSLCDLQAGFRTAVLAADETGIAHEIVDDRLGASARLAIYRHHLFTSLTAVLEATYPVVTRLVDRRFFGWVADCYIRAHPPSGPCLFEYGSDFADFLAGLPACAYLPWLADVARLEWAMNAAMHAPDAAPLDADAWRSLTDNDLAQLTIRFDPSVTLLTSAWPVDAVWRANQSGGDGVVDLERGAVHVQVNRVGDDVVFRALTPAAFAFRAALAEGRTLHEAAEQAFEVEPRLVLAAEIRELLDEQVLTSG